MKKYFAAAMLSTALLASGALAQTATNQNAMSHNGMWRSSKVIGLNVYNEKNEKLGDINELILDKAGKIDKVVIGVGGFLGMGEHDIAVTYDKLKFVNEPMRTSDTRPATTRETTTTGTGTGMGASTGTAATTTTTTTTANRGTTNANWYPDHAVLDASKDQLKAMPQFKYSDNK